MNGRHWPTTTDALAMLDVLFPFRGQDSTEPQSRPSRLYLLACARRAWDRLPGVCRAVVAAAERVYIPWAHDRRLRVAVEPHAEALFVRCRGEADEVNAVGRALADLGLAAAADIRTAHDYHPAEWTGYAALAYFPFERETPHFRRVPADLHSADLVREMFWGPYAAVPLFDPRWATDTVLQLAREAQATTHTDVFLRLHDALHDAGCAVPAVLDHLRPPTAAHAPGCRVVEWVLAGARRHGAGGL